jgi:hypothetical protein
VLANELRAKRSVGFLEGLMPGYIKHGFSDLIFRIADKSEI